MTNDKKINIFVAWILVLIYAALIFYMSSLQQPLPKNISNHDKLLHMIEYAVFAVLIFRALIISNSNVAKKVFFILAVIISTLYGASDELHQYFVPGRSMGGADLFFDFLGAILGISLYNKVIYGNNKIV